MIMRQMSCCLKTRKANGVSAAVLARYINGFSRIAVWRLSNKNQSRIDMAVYNYHVKYVIRYMALEQATVA